MMVELKGTSTASTTVFGGGVSTTALGDPANI